MPPRTKKVKSKTEETIVSDDPIIYFLKVPKDRQDLYKEETLPEAFENRSYSDILKEEENVNYKFDQTIIQSIISKIHLQTEYPPNTACFWCCHPFSWNSFVLPINYDFYINQYVSEGNFCSPECSLAWCYKDISLTDSQRWIRHSLLRELYSDLYKNNENIIPAPDKRCLRMFGGTLSIDQYRRYVKEGGGSLQLELPPIRLYMPSINTQASYRDVKSYVSLSNETVDKASQQLRLKRTKPVHSNTPTLDKCMGLNG